MSVWSAGILPIAVEPHRRGPFNVESLFDIFRRQEYLETFGVSPEDDPDLPDYAFFDNLDEFSAFMHGMDLYLSFIQGYRTYVNGSLIIPSDVDRATGLFMLEAHYAATEDPFVGWLLERHDATYLATRSVGTQTPAISSAGPISSPKARSTGSITERTPHDTSSPGEATSDPEQPEHNEPADPSDFKRLQQEVESLRVAASLLQREVTGETSDFHLDALRMKGPQHFEPKQQKHEVAPPERPEDDTSDEEVDRSGASSPTNAESSPLTAAPSADNSSTRMQEPGGPGDAVVATVVSMSAGASSAASTVTLDAPARPKGKTKRKMGKPVKTTKGRKRAGQTAQRQAAPRSSALLLTHLGGLREPKNARERRFMQHEIGRLMSTRRYAEVHGGFDTGGRLRLFGTPSAQRRRIQETLRKRDEARAALAFQQLMEAADEKTADADLVTKPPV